MFLWKRSKKETFPKKVSFFDGQKRNDAIKLIFTLFNSVILWAFRLAHKRKLIKVE